MIKRQSVIRKTQAEKGFTLTELLVTLTVFSIIIGGILGIFISGVRHQRLTLFNRILLDQTSFALELMGRALRMADKELSAPSCLSQQGLNYELTRSGSGLKFINSLENQDCQEFFLEDGQLKYFKKSTLQTLPLTSDQLEITSLRFNLIGEAQLDDIQPRVTLFLSIGGKALGISKIEIQTTISQRNLDITR